MLESHERRTFRDHMDLLLDDEDKGAADEVYSYLMANARSRGLKNTLEALVQVRSVIEDGSGSRQLRRAPEGRRGWWLHGLTMARILLDLDPPVPEQELDVMLAACLGHVLRELLVLTDPEKELNELFPLDPEVWRTVMLVTGDSGHTEQERRAYYDRVRTHRPALLVKLAGRGDVVSRLNRLPLESSMHYARETRKYFLPMCIRAREEYPELHGILRTLMEKMRCLVEVADVLDLRFAGMEKELEMEILDLHQDNSRLRGILARMGIETDEEERNEEWEW